MVPDNKQQTVLVLQYILESPLRSEDGGRRRICVTLDALKSCKMALITCTRCCVTGSSTGM